MNISYNWLHEYITDKVAIDDLSKILTGCGLEVESIEKFDSVKGGLKDLVVGEVIETRKHPNADRLTVTKVNLGAGIISQIVCGAPNVATGQKVIVARPGTILHPLKGDAFEIKNSKIRGEVSEGMICAEDEIGLGDNHDGVIVLKPDAVPGDDARDYFSIENDYTISIGLTPNRADAMSHIGVARDVKAVLNTRSLENFQVPVEVKWPSLDSFKTPDRAPEINVIVSSEACIRYSGIHISNIKVGPSPEWLRSRLRAIGLKPVNNIVDITNFVLFETGQPLHAFDASKISGKTINVKTLPKGSTFKTLDGVDRILTGTELMICDDNGGLCIAGIYGGLSSGVENGTQEIFLESACFDTVSIRKSSRSHGLKTDASYRFERGTDPEMTITALKRAAILILDIAGGSVSSSIIDIYPSKVKNFSVVFSLQNFKNLTRVELPEEHIKKILAWLDIKINSENSGIYNLQVPAYRVDVTREADVIEEILRIYGYDRIPSPSKMNTSFPSAPLVKLEQVRRKISAYLVANGFFEVMSNSLSKSTSYTSAGAVKIKNPLSKDLDILRENMLFPMLDVVLYNTNRKRPDLRLFEFGKTYGKSESGYYETNHLSVLISGNRNEEHWEIKQKDYSIYYLKSIVENMMTVAGINISSFKWEPVEKVELEYGMIFRSGKKDVAVIGLLAKKTLSEFDLSGLKWFVDLNLDVIDKLISGKAKVINEPPKFPEVRRDLSILLDKNVEYHSLETLAYESDRKFLKAVNLFDVYQGDRIGEEKKSYAISFIMRDDDKTLTDKEIDKVMQRIMDAFEKKLGAVIRKS